MLFELVGVGFDPLGGAEQGGLFAVPKAVDDRALRLPALLEKIAEAVGLFELGAGSAEGVAGTVDPGVVVIAADDPLVGHGGTGDLCDDVVERLAIPVEGESEMRHDLAGAGHVRERERAAPVLRHELAAERLEEGRGVGVGDGHDGDLGDGLDVRKRDQFCAGYCADAGRLRVAGVDGHVHDAAALDAVRWTHGAFGIDRSAVVAVLVRVGVDKAADSAMLGGELGLDATPGLAVARDDDGAFDGDSHGLELLVVGWCAEVDVDERGGDVAVTGVGVVGGQLLGLLVGGGVDGEDRLV